MTWQEEFEKQFIQNDEDGRHFYESGNVDGVIKFIETEIIKKIINDIEITLTTSNMLNDDDLLRGILGIQDPRVIDLYHRDLQNRMIKLRELRNKYLTKQK